jgi:hypothetical protein
VRLNSPKGKSAGLFRRITGAHSFHILARARFIAGDGMTLFAYVTAGGQVYQLKLREEEVEVSGRKIPLHTSDWHEYLLSSDDGRFARFYVDGEMISSRIPALPGGTFTAKGLYCLYSGSGETVSGELEYVKVRH